MPNVTRFLGGTMDDPYYVGTMPGVNGRSGEFEAIARQIEGALAEFGLPSATVGVARDGEILKAGAFFRRSPPSRPCDFGRTRLSGVERRAIGNRHGLVPEWIPVLKE